MVTGKEMCEEIIKADFLIKSDGTKPSAEEVWNYSPRGELMNVFCWYEKALAINLAKLNKQVKE